MTTLKVNGKDHTLDVGARTLLMVLREDLNLQGARYSCGIGYCGACTVLVDGEPVSSCLLLAAQLEGKEITTIEGLAQDGQLHPVQQAFVEHNAFQCAFCTSGFILSSVALLNENPAPSPDEIREYLGGHLCRCGSYQHIVKAVLAASKQPNGH